MIDPVLLSSQPQNIKTKRRCNATSFFNFKRNKSLNFKNIFLFTVILFLAFSCYSDAQQSLIRAIKRGLELQYDFKWAQSEDIFQSLIKKYPNDPRSYHYLASIYMWRYLSNQDKTDLETFTEYSDTAIAKGEKLLQKNNDKTTILYTLGTDYSCRAVAFAKAEKFLDAVWASKKSESYLNETLAADSNYYDAYLGLGLYNYAVGQIPAAFKWALSLAGIKGDKEAGLKYIKKSAHFGNLSKVEAQYYLSQILSEFLADYNKSYGYLKNLAARYPNNSLFNYSLAVLDIKRRRLDDADKILSKILLGKDTTFKQIVSYTNFLKGDIRFKQNQFESAKKFYLYFINNSVSKDYKGIAYYRLALCYEITGNHEEAVKYFSLTDKGSTDIEDDAYAERKGSVYSKRTLSQNEIDLVMYKNLIDNAKYRAAYDSLSALIDKLKTDKLKAEIYLNLSESAYYLGLYKESLDFASTARTLNNFNENWIKPYSCYYAALVSKKLNDDQAFNALITEAEGYSDYDYQKKLKNLLFALTSSD